MLQNQHLKHGDGERIHPPNRFLVVTLPLHMIAEQVLGESVTPPTQGHFHVIGLALRTGAGSPSTITPASKTFTGRDEARGPGEDNRPNTLFNHGHTGKGERVMLCVTIQLTGNTTDDLMLAANEVTRAIGEGFLAGSNSNDTGSYCFDIKGEPFTPEDESGG